ncbi:MAG: ribbon-helix-helix domain-containing protein [Methanobacteriota archaeon]
MSLTRINVLVPQKLLNESRKLVGKGYFSNFSELVRDGIRKEIRDYNSGLTGLTEKDRELLAWAKQAKRSGDIFSGEDMEEHGLKL